MDAGLPQDLVDKIQSDQITEDICSEAITLLTQEWRNTGDQVAQSLLLLLVRISNSWTSVYALSKHADDRVRGRSEQDIGALFRIMFEAYIQAAYIRHDRGQQIQRATLFLEFGHVERMKLHDRILQHDTAFTRILKSSPKRPTGDPQLRAAFDRVAPLFLNSKKRRQTTRPIRPSEVRDHWYKGSLRDLASEIGALAEYDLWVAAYHGCIHSSVSGCSGGCLMDVSFTATWAAQIVVHTIMLCLDYANVQLCADHQSWIDVVTEDRLGTIPDEVAKTIVAKRSATLPPERK